MDVYLSESGSGKKDGSSIANAMALKQMTDAMKVAGPGGKVLMIADQGAYDLAGAINLYVGGTADKPLTITGIDSKGAPATVVFEGTRAPVYKAGMAAGNESFKLFSGADHIVFENMQFNNVGNAFRVAADVSDITVRNVDADNVAMFFYTLASKTGGSAAVSDLTIQNVEVHGFSKGVVRLTYDSKDIRIDNVLGDSERQDGNDFAIGVHLTGTVHDVAISNTIMENISDSTNRYWNGDGFATEGGVYNVTISDSISRGNTDGGFDLKSSTTTLIRTVAADNARNYRIWGDVTLVDVEALNPHKRGGIGAQAQIEVTKTGSVKIKDSYIADAGSSTGVFKLDGKIVMENTQVVHAATGALVHRDSSTKFVPGAAEIVPTLGYFSTNYAFAGKVGAAAFTGAMPAPNTVVAPPVTAPQPALMRQLPVSETLSPAPEPVAPQASAPAPAVVSPGVLAPAPTLLAETHVVAATAQQAAATTSLPPPEATAVTVRSGGTVTGTSAAEAFQVEQGGAKTIRSFSVADVAVFKTQFKDGNKDGIIDAGKNKMFNETGGGSLKIADVSALRYLGKSDDGFVYARADVRKKGMSEGTVGNDTLKADAGDKKAQNFLFDTALKLDLGHDKITGFGAKDTILTTTALQLGDDGRAHAGTGGFALHDGMDDAFTIVGLNSLPVPTLERDGSIVMGGLSYHVYSMVGSSGGLANFPGSELM